MDDAQLGGSIVEDDVTVDDAQAWLDAYVDAWRSYDRAAVEALFDEDAEYRYHPWDEPVRGRAAIVEDWLAPGGDEAKRDAPDSWRASYRPLAIDGDLVIATGTTEYIGGDTYDNMWVLRFDPDGRCTDFTEWYMKRP